MGTTLRKLFADVNPKMKTEPNFDGLAAELLSHDSFLYDESGRLECYFVRTHLCTDTWVGIRLYILDGEKVCYSQQSARKSSELFYFFSEDCGVKVRNYLLSLIKEEYPVFTTAGTELDKPRDTLFQVEYSEQILHKHGYYQGKKVPIIQKRFPFNDGTRDYFEAVIIEVTKGVQRKVKVSELWFEYNNID